MKKRLQDAFREYWLEALLFAIAVGNADVLRQYMVKTGSQETWQLTVAIYATEVLIASVSMWGVPGLVLALVMFATSLWSISHMFGDQFIGHAYFSISLFAGSVANYVRRAERSRAYTKAFNQSHAPAVPGQPATVPASQFTFNAKGQLDPTPFVAMGASGLRAVFGLSHNKAKELRAIFLAGDTVTKQWLDENRINPQPSAIPGQPASP